MPSVITVKVGGNFRVTWVSSGATASPICFNLRTGSETLANSWGGIDSTNGAYYADVAIGSVGVWKGEWYATVFTNTYRNTDWYLAYAGDADQPGRYINWDDVVQRFVGFANVADAVKAASHYVCYAEAEVDARLAIKYTPPFSNNNMTVRDLAIDMAYLRCLRGKTELYDQLKKSIDERVGWILSGTMIMVTTSGALDSPSQAWSNTSGYKSLATQTLPVEDWVPDSQQFYDEATERGYVVDPGQ